MYLMCAGGSQGACMMSVYVAQPSARSSFESGCAPLSSVVETRERPGPSLSHVSLSRARGGRAGPRAVEISGLSTAVLSSLAGRATRSARPSSRRGSRSARWVSPRATRPPVRLSLSRACDVREYEHLSTLFTSVLHFISSTLSMSYGPRMRPGRCRENDRATGPRESHRRGYV